VNSEIIEITVKIFCAHLRASAHRCAPVLAGVCRCMQILAGSRKDTLHAGRQVHVFARSSTQLHTVARSCNYLGAVKRTRLDSVTNSETCLQYYDMFIYVSYLYKISLCLSCSKYYHNVNLL